MKLFALILFFLLIKNIATAQDCFSCKNIPKGALFCDDFESDAPLMQRYFEYDNNNGDFVRKPGTGKNGSAGMQVSWQKGEVSAGNLKVAIGRNPIDYINRQAIQNNKDFTEIYWRLDVRYDENWEGGGADKLTRATALVGENWKQGFMAHIWSGSYPNQNYMVMDPASGLDATGNLKSTKYNDFPNLRWLGNKRGTVNLFSPENKGNWQCVVAHVKLNTPGKSDGIFELWVNGILQAGSYHLNWHGNYNEKPDSYKINAIFFENYWNAGSPKDQKRYFDNILISTEPIICDCGK